MLRAYLKLFNSSLKAKLTLHLLRTEKGVVFFYSLVFSSLSWNGVTFIFKGILLLYTTYHTSSSRTQDRIHTIWVSDHLNAVPQSWENLKLSSGDAQMTDKEKKTLRTKWNRLLLDMPTKAQLVSKLPAFHGLRRIINMLIRASHWSKSWVRLIQLIFSHPISLRSILILASHVHAGFPSGPIPWHLHAETFSPVCAACIIFVKTEVVQYHEKIGYIIYNAL
jgi:hypothetical protein